MSELRSVIEELRREVLTALPDARIDEDFSELHRAIEQLELERLRRLAELTRRGLHERDGFVSATAWVKQRCGVSGGEAKRAVRTARALEHMPRVREALETGEVTLSAARVLVEAHQAAPEAFGSSEELLVEAARRHAVADLYRVVSHWRERVQRDRFDPREGRRLHASITLGGMLRVDGDLDPEAGETLLTALSAVIDAEARTGETDVRTPAQRRADALEEICRSYLDRTERPTVAGERPHLVVTVPFEALTGDGAAELDRLGGVHPEVVRRLGCDASVTRVVISARSEPLDVGRRTPVVPTAIRRGVIVRDRTCRFPGCDRHHAWCDAHHVTHWSDGGETSLGNLVLLCRRHHRAVHDGGFGMEMDGSTPVFRRPDGSRLEDRGPPRAGHDLGGR